MADPIKNGYQKPGPPDLIAALTQKSGLVSALEHQLADSILADLNFATNASITHIAARAGVSPPTVTRFCRRLGCASFSDFKLQLARSAYVGMRYLRPEAITATPAEVAEDIVTKARNALFDLHHSLDLDAISKAASLLNEARIIYAFGAGGGSTIIASELQNRLFRLGCTISASSDQGMNLMLSAAAERGAVIFGSSFTGRNDELVRCFEMLRERGIPTIALTQSGSPVAAASDLLLAVDLPEGQNIFRPTSTRFAFLAVIDMLANLVAYEDRERSTRHLRNIKEQLVRHRDGDDRQVMGD
ncbi:MurR/RpiR family transcriptional regulator [Paracoccus sp. SCSIO 75233]|uniref:MurR/RpiR family transcriptional regulator n=1 Tax=Paracoccus sp. SCSIO 75233 TaxID=3017782 RepID=UPI0022F07336|nr:MurR/RpiR family transcriptional regulator [Paracoccus sp. SCSIO 75233]WBU52349.1 MurR/RpiR family transcriptional regulator [Paracoccus sp. SCSIO 75233]